MAFTYIRRAAVALALVAPRGCTVKNTEAPPLSGPSGLALTLERQRDPRQHQPGRRIAVVDQSDRDRPGRANPLANVPIRVDMAWTASPRTTARCPPARS